MKHSRVGMIVLLVLSLLSVSLAFAAGGFGLDWWSVDGGGGVSRAAGGGYAVAGSAGQPDAGEMSGGGYTVSGGVWQAIPSATPTPTTTSTAVPSATATPTASASPTPVPTLTVGGPSSKSVYLPLIMNGVP